MRRLTMPHVPYVRVTILLGHRPARIDCSRLHELEIARMKRAIELLKMVAG